MFCNKKLNFISMTVIIRMVAIGISCIACLVSVLIYSFMAFVPAVKAQFNLTQTEVSVIASVVMLTAIFGFPAGVVYDKFGMTPTITVGMVLTTIGFSGLWLTSLAPHLSTASFYCLIFSRALAGHGRSYLDILTFAYVLAMIPRKYRTAAILLVELSFDCGNSIFSLVYESGFARVNGKDIPPLNQNLTEYLLIGLIITFVTNMMTASVLPMTKKYMLTETDMNDDKKNNSPSHDTAEKNVSDNITKNSYQLGSSEVTTPTGTKKSTFYHDILTKIYMFITAVFAINLAISSFSQTNITLVTQSLNLSKLDYYILILQRPAVTACKTLTTGVIMLTKRFTFSREILIAASSLFITASQVLLMIKAESETILVVAYACIYLGHGLTVMACINMITTIFSFERFGANFGFMMGCIPFASTIIQMIFGRLYDGEIADGGGIYCTGKHCTYRFYQITTGLSSFSVIMALCLLIVQIRKRYTTKM